MKPRTGILIKCTIVMVMMAICFPACSKKTGGKIEKIIVAEKEIMAVNHVEQEAAAIIPGTQLGRQRMSGEDNKILLSKNENERQFLVLAKENKQQTSKQQQKKTVDQKDVAKKESVGSISHKQSKSKEQPRAKKKTTTKQHKEKTAYSSKIHNNTKKNSKVKKMVARHRFVSLKTNVSLDAVAIQNIALEVGVHKHITVDFPIIWSISDIEREHGLRTMTFQPEGRWWLKPTEEGGHFFGLHTHFAWFNLKWNENRYQSFKRPLMGAGISYGYRLYIGKHWGAEINIGFGYANMKYDTYYNIENGAYIDTRIKNYWGITRAGLSLVYRF